MEVCKSTKDEDLKRTMNEMLTWILGKKKGPERSGPQRKDIEVGLFGRL